MARKVEYTFDPFDIAGIDKSKATRDQQREVLSRAKDLVLESVLLDVAQQKSPVTGRPFKKLDPKYAAQKRREGGTAVANLELSGKLMDSVRVVSRGDKLTLTVEGSQSDKADGHNNHSGESKLPKRPFIPDEGETFRPGIREELKTLIRSVVDGDEDNG